MEFRTPTVSPLRQRMLDDMRMRKLQPRTQAGYIRAVRRLAILLEQAPTPPSVALHAPRGHLQQPAAQLGRARRDLPLEGCRAKGKTRCKAMTLGADEFMRRFLLHTLPSGLHRIRHYGLLASVRQRHLRDASQR